MTPPATGQDDAVGSASGPRPSEHNWRPTVVHGALAWLLLAVALLLPVGGPLSLGVGIVGLLVVPVLPVTLCCDYRQARANGECAPAVRAYLTNLAADVVTTVTRRDPLGSARGDIERC